jgi:hypothetical protein
MRIYRIAVVAALTISSLAGGQAPRIRFRIVDSLGAPGLEIRGALARITADSLEVSVDGTAGTLAVARSSVRGLMISRGRRSRIGSFLHAAKPTAVFVGAHAVVFSGMSASSRSQALVLTTALPIALTLPRAIAAAFSRTERWERVPEDAVFEFAARAPNGSR